MPAGFNFPAIPGFIKPTFGLGQPNAIEALFGPGVTPDQIKALMQASNPMAGLTNGALFNGGPGANGGQGPSASGMGGALSPGGMPGTIGGDANNISVPATLSNVMAAAHNALSMTSPMGLFGFAARQAQNRNFTPLSVQAALNPAISDMIGLSPDQIAALDMAAQMGIAIDSISGIGQQGQQDQDGGSGQAAP